MTENENRFCRSSKAVVSSGRPEASQIGVDILNMGGNAIDAAVAVGFAMGVAEPATSGLGGGGFMTIKAHNSDQPVFIDFRECAPKSASSTMWTFDDYGKVYNKENAIGGKSVSVPGEVAGLLHIHKTYGQLPLETLIKPSIDLCDQGIHVSTMLEEMLTKYQDHLGKCENAKKIYFDQSKPLRAGSKLINNDLGQTLRAIVDGREEAFYQGEIGASIVKTVIDHGGLMSHEDLRDYTVTELKPLVGTYRGYTIISSPPPSSGGTHVIQALNILEQFDLSAMAVNSKEYIHLLSEVFKLVYEDRAKFMADTNFIEVPLKGLRSKKYAKLLSKKIDENVAYQPDVFDPWTYEHDDTTHYSVGDKAGNLVSVTKTINHFFGSCLVAEGTGVLLNDTMADFSTNQFDVNAVDSRKKPLSSMSPTIILKDNRPVAILGSPGGMRIINVVVQVISKLIDHNMSIKAAIESPRITQNATNTMLYETRIDKSVVEGLEAMGHQMKACLSWDKKMGGVNGVYYEEDNIVGYADPRRDGESYGL